MPSIAGFHSQFLNCVRDGKEFLMVSNHSLKQQARELSEKLKINYTQALEIVKNREAFDLRENLSEQQLAVAKKAAQAILDGFDLIVYGGTGSGKTSMIHAVMEELEGTPRVLLQRELEYGLKTSDPTYERVGVEYFTPTNPAVQSQYDLMKEYYEDKNVLAFDEARYSDDLESVRYFKTKPIIFSVHASNAEHAVKRLGTLDYFGGKPWEFARVLHCSYDHVSKVRSASLYENVETEKKSKRGFENYTEELKAMATSLVQVLGDFKAVPIAEALQKAADYHRTTPSMMKYALSYAHTKRYVEIDYDEGTVIRLP